MDFGVVLQTNPPAHDVVAKMKRAEEAGFSYGWTWDSHVLWHRQHNRDAGHRRVKS